MAIWRVFFKFEALKTAITICKQAVTPDPASSILKKVRQTAISICSGLSHTT
jgi:hypothetical protein